MNSREVIRTLLSGLPAEVRLYRELEQLLKQQYLLMGRHQTAALETLSQQEVPVLAQLRQYAFRRSHLLKVLGLEPNADGMSLLIQKLPAGLSQQTANAWQELQHFYANCKLQNEQNGRLLVFQRETLERLLFGEPDRDYGMRQVTG